MQQKSEFENFRLKHIEDLYICIDNKLFHEYFDGNHVIKKNKKTRYLSDNLSWKLNVMRNSDVFQRENLLRTHFHKNIDYIIMMCKEYIDLFRKRYEIEINIEISLIYDEKCSQNLCKPLNNEEYVNVLENLVFSLAMKSFFHFDDLITRLIINKNLLTRLDFDIKSMDISWRNREGDNIMHILSIIGDCENLEYFMDKYKERIYDKTIDGYTILTLAMKNGHKNIKDMIINKNINYIKMRWSNYKTRCKKSLYPNLLIKHACFDEYRIMERYIITKMITIEDMYFLFEPYDETPLHLILSLGRTRSLACLIDRGFVTMEMLYRRNKYNKTPIDVMKDNTKTLIEYFLNTHKKTRID